MAIDQNFRVASDLLRNTAVISFGMLAFDYARQRMTNLPGFAKSIVSSAILGATGFVCVLNEIVLPDAVTIDLLTPLAILGTIFGGIETGALTICFVVAIRLSFMSAETGQGFLNDSRSLAGYLIAWVIVFLISAAGRRWRERLGDRFGGLHLAALAGAVAIVPVALALLRRPIAAGPRVLIDAAPSFLAVTILTTIFVGLILRSIERRRSATIQLKAAQSGLVASNAELRSLTNEYLRARDEAQEANRAKSQFLANMNHELRTPLNAIIGFSEMIRDAAIGPLDTRYRQYAEDVNSSGRHLQSIINDVLDISKIEASALELRDECVSIGEAAEACGRMVAAMAQSANVSLSIGVPASLPLVRVDPVRFNQVLLNLMSNAVKFTPIGGHVGVSASVEGDAVVVVIEDTGIGMNAEEIEIALQPFRQVDGQLARRFPGTGLGLPLAKSLVELHGGSLDIHSVPAAGTTVRIRLPSERTLL